MNDDYKMTIAEIERRKQEIADLEADAARLRAGALEQFVSEITDHASAMGVDLEWLAERLAPRKRPGLKKGSGGSRPRHVWVNPADRSQVYRGRGKPDWLVALMRERGYDPEDKESRYKAREELLVKEAA